MAQKYALVVGCTYPNTKFGLDGCHNDAKSIYELLVNRFEFKETHIELLIDEPGVITMPTSSNIKTIMKKLFSVAKSGDVVFFFYAGHGTLIPGYNSSSGRDEQAIIPCDFNLITCMDFREILDGAPDGVTFAFMSDSCNSGGLIDKETEQIGPHRNPNNQAVSTNQRIRMVPFQAVLQQLSLQTSINDTINIQTHFTQLFGLENVSLAFRNIPHNQLKQPLKADQGILLSACQPDELSQEKFFYGITMFDGKYHGVYTWAVLNVLRRHGLPITNREFVLQVRDYIEKAQFKDQHPCLFCSDENASASFLLQKS